jgi:protease IV
MIRKFLPILILIACSSLTADIARSFIGEFSTATSDDAFSLIANPAGLGIPNASGFAYMTPYDEDSFKRSYSLLFYGKGIGYSFDRTEKLNSHRLAVSNPITRNLYLGFNWDWNRGAFHDGDYGASTLFRPINALSVGSMSMMHPGNHRLDTHQIGLGIRPVILKGTVWNRVTLTGDETYSRFDKKWRKPVLGIETELVNGLRLNGNYNTDSKTIGLNFSLCSTFTRTGTAMRMNDDNRLDQGLLYLHLTSNAFRTWKYPRPNTWRPMKMRPEVVDKPARSKFGPIVFTNGRQEALADVLADIDRLAKDPHTAGILFKTGNVRMSFAHACEIRDALLRFKQTGKKVAFYFDDIGNLNYALAASVADRIYLNPMGGVDLKGFSISTPYIRELLDTLGVDIYNFRSHPYKTAGNMFSEKEMPPAEREALDYILSGFYDEYKKMISSGRGDRLTKPIDEIVDGGPYPDGETAFRLGLVDGLFYEDEIPEQLIADGKKGRIVPLDIHNMQIVDWSEPESETVALIYASGNIHMGESLPGKSIGAKTYADAIRRAREEKQVKGIILRVDSGGGSALASDIITREIRLCKEGKNRKPVIVSMGGMAGSGGYYISTYADMIIAEPTTITGSIGVIGITFDIERLLDKMHVNFSTVKKGRHGDFGQIYRKMTPEEQDIISRSIEHTYNVFVDHVAAGRSMNHDAVHAIAQGRIWTGTQAKDRSLVDKIGGLTTAFDEMKQTLHAEHLQIVEYPANKGIRINADLPFPGVTTAMPREMQKTLDNLTQWTIYGDEKTLVLIPYLWDLEME